jgi:hypothetical protein
MPKIRRYLVPDTESYAHHNGYTDVEIVTPRGNFTKRVQQAETRAAWLNTPEEQNQKFLKCAIPILGEDQAAQALRIARDCHNLEDVSALPRSTVPQGKAKKTGRTTV